MSNIELPPAKLPGVSQLYYQHVQNAKDPTRDAKLASASEYKMGDAQLGGFATPGDRA